MCAHHWRKPVAMLQYLIDLIKIFVVLKVLSHIFLNSSSDWVISFDRLPMRWDENVDKLRLSRSIKIWIYITVKL